MLSAIGQLHRFEEKAHDLQSWDESDNADTITPQ